MHRDNSQRDFARTLRNNSTNAEKHLWQFLRSRHVHLLISMSRTIAVADAVRVVKSNSSAWMHDEIDVREFQWQEGYGAFAVSYSNVEQVQAYVAKQAEHHHISTFQDEFRELLRRHDLEWDERYVWD